MYGAVVFCLLCIINSLYAIDINITVDPGIGSTCTTGNFIICSNLDSAIRYTVSLQRADTDNSSVTISLPNGVHYITTQTNFGDASVNFVGLDHNVAVVCEYYANNETFDATQIHTWYFNKSRSVGMENIHFRNCGFPFRFVLVERVNIDNCTYM